MPPLTNMLISASAGTGKTYQLSLRFLGLLALNHGRNPERLIAITFTRKAAGEFKDRILTDLAKGAADDSGAQELKEQLWTVIKGTAEEPGIWPQAPDSWKEEHLHQESFRHMLRILVQNLSRLNLCTIDSLFSQIASTSAFELGVSGFSMINNTQEKLARKEALLTLYRECSRDAEHARQFETAFLSGADSDADAADAEESMTRRIKSYHELFLDEPDVRKWGNPLTLGFTPETLMIPIPLEQFNEVLYSLINQAMNTPVPEGKKAMTTRNMFLRFLNAFRPYVKLGKVRFRTEGGSSWDITVEKARMSYADFWSPRLDDLLESWMRMEVINSLQRTRSTHELMSIFESKYSALIRNQGKFLFHDVTRMLGDGVVTPDFKRDLQYRMYCRYDHWMLDEFQDTSQSQWRVIKPFLDDLTDSKAGAEGSIFIVGDIKQSVYQWRGGDPELFRSVASRLQLDERGMATSYRSVQPVLDMVNDLCDYARTAPDSSPEALKQWGHYPAHASAPHLAARSGCAQIWQTPKMEEATAASDPVCQAVADILTQTDALRRGLDTAVLVGTRAKALTVKTWLTDHGIPAELSDDVPLGIDSPLGKNLLHFFRWLLSPGDSFVIDILAHSPLRTLMKPDQPEGRDWTEWHLLLEREGYAAVMAALERGLALTGVELTDFQRDRLNVWLNEAEQVDEAGMPLYEWIQHMEDLTRREDPAGGIVRIMTIHKSKGLGFDIVILPQIGRDAPFADARHLTHFVKKDAEGGIQGIIMAPSKHIYTNVPQLHSLYEEWKAQQEFDGFCKLYVALTRAKRATYIILPYQTPSKKEVSTDSMWKIIRQAALKCEQGTKEVLPESGAECLYSIGNAQWHQEIVPTKHTNPLQSKTPGWPAQKPFIRERISPSAMHPAAVPPSSVQQATPHDPGAFGTQVHAVFERITRWDDDQKPEWALNPATEAERNVAACMEIPSIRALFTQPPSARIMKEQRIEAIEGQAWISGVIDRLIITGNTAHLVDFKTDRVATEEELKTRHQEQLNIYARIIANIIGIPLEHIRQSIVSTHLQSVIELPHASSQA